MANFTGFDRMIWQDDKVQASFMPTGYSNAGNCADVRAAIAERIESEKKPSVVLAKALERIAHHTEQLEDALSQLFTTYERMVTPQQRTSATAKARHDMLDLMPSKALQEFARSVLQDEMDDYIWPDDRNDVIERLTAVLSTDKEKAEPATVAVSAK